MKKTKWFRSKALFTLTVFIALFCFAATSSWAARDVKFTKKTKHDYMKKLNQGKKHGKSDIAEALGLTGDDSLTLIRSRSDRNGVTHYRYQQTYKDIPVWGMESVVSINPSNEVVRLHGNLVLDIPYDIKGIPRALNPKKALKDLQTKHQKKDKKAKWNFSNEKYGTYIYVDNKDKAYVCYVISFFADNEEGNPSQFIYFVDAKNGKVINSYDMLRYAEGTGPGGNLKIGQYYYGTDYPGFGVTASGSTCTMNTTDVKTVDLNHGTSGSTAYSYTCYENTHESINGGYCPLNDAQYFGQVIYDMYMDWYSVPVLPFQLTMKVHYSTNYENAFWDGSSMTFGDGYTTFYPLVCLDVSAHEVSHGFTENNSNLTYSGQPGGINESFSDMAGEAAKYYMRGTNDFMVGYDIFKSASGALRYMYDPPLDGQSIDNVADYYSGLDVHYSSGIFNKAFYLIATSPGWTTQMAFDIFTKANIDYWTASTTFVQGAEGAQDAAADYGYSCSDVRDAFAQVGIDLVCAGPPVANFSGTPTSGGAPLTVVFTDLSSNDPTSWSWSFSGGSPSSSTSQNPTVTYSTPGTYSVTLTATNSSGSDTETKTNYITVLAPQPPVADFTASTTNPTVGGTVNFTDTSTNAPTSWSWTFSGGTPGTSTAQNPSVTYNTEGTYDVSLTVTNAQGSDTETKVGYIQVSAIPYCSSQGNNYSYEWISRVVVGSLDNSSGAAGYTDFTGITGNLTAGNSVSVALTPGFSSSSYTEYWKIWIDYNGDHDFADSGEQVYSGSGSSQITGSFTVPSGLNIVTRMRVSMKYNAAPTSCETFTYGEVEDYTVNISGGVIQPPVAAFTASATTVTVGGSVTFTDQSTNNPTSWAWSFEGGTPTSSTSQNPTVTYNTEGTYNVSLTATNSAGSDTEAKIDYITVTAAPADEIAEAVDYGTLTFTKSGSADWYRVTDVYYNGGDSARSGAISNSQSTTIETTVTVGSTQAVKFYWKVSSEANYDYLKFYIDGVQKNQIAGTVDWTQVSNNIAAGTHTLKWSYVKDGSVASGSDCGWVDKLEITTAAADPIAEAVDDASLTFTLSGNGNWFSETTTTYYGGDAAQSADISNSQSTTMETTISGKTSVKFYWRVSSEANYDYLKFYIDGVQQAQIAGTVSWTQKSYTVSSGTHTLKWSYVKDYSVSSGSDCGWVDKLELQ
jgi:vibriolysin